MKAITNIQRFSIHDGDGIRTTVFFKGCPLKCVWCHNPETQRYDGEVEYDEEKCTGCGSCIGVCPQGALSFSESHKIIRDEKKCTLCGKCEQFCPSDIRELIGKEYTEKELLKELLKDEMFYEESGGGVTFSGGEVMTQDIEYLVAVAKGLKKQGITLTIDTCGYADFSRFEALLPYVDTFLYDLKCMDDVLHVKYTGVSNKLILDNLIKLSNKGARIYIRIPTVKEVNGNKENMESIINFIKDNNIKVACVNLLPYHDTGSGKYRKLGLTYDGKSLHAPSDEEMKELVLMFKKNGFDNVKIGG